MQHDGRNYAVPYVDLPAQYAEQREELLAAIDATFAAGAFISRPPVARFESALADRLGVRECVGVNSGTDALYLIFEAMNIGPGDEVITPAHTFVASVAAIARRGATPVFADVGADGNVDPRDVEAKITDRTRAVLAVHMNGRCCAMDRLLALCESRQLPLVEDAAQALGAEFQGRAAGSFGIAAAFSLHPMKVLGVGGDGGVIATSDRELATRLRRLRNHGQEQGTVVEYGVSSRLDTLHAVVAELRLPRLDAWIERRRAIAARYDASFSRIEGLQLPPGPEVEAKAERRYDIYSSYVLRSSARDRLHEGLRQAGVECFSHWPIPLHRQPAWASPVDLPRTQALSAECLSIPVHPQLSDEQVDHVIAAVREHTESTARASA